MNNNSACLIDKRHIDSGLRQRGFTIIELLVVICIITTLFAMLAPALRRSLEMTYMLQCANKMRELGYWLDQYQKHNHGNFPPIYSYRGPTTEYHINSKPTLNTRAGWSYDFYTYFTGIENAGGAAAYHCPVSGHTTN